MLQIIFVISSQIKLKVNRRKSKTANRVEPTSLFQNDGAGCRVGRSALPLSGHKGGTGILLMREARYGKNILFRNIIKRANN